MTIIFSGNDYKYELEAVLKLFIPAVSFKHIYGDKIECGNNYIFARQKETKNKTLLYIICNYAGVTKRSGVLLNKKDDEADPDKELCLSRILYKVMSEITGIVPKWGVLTGIRPVKRVNTFLNEGLTEKEIFDKLKEEYLCSDEKCRIAYDTAMTQKKVLDELRPGSFSLYVNIPFCPTRCSYCSFISQTYDSGKKLIPEYLEKLCREIRYTGRLARELSLRLDTVYFGGGTPTTLTPEQLGGLMKTIELSFDMSHVREYTIEAGRPDTVTEDKLRTIKAGGCTRISINPQTLSQTVLDNIGRGHTVEQFFSAYELGRRMGFECINTDLIAGLPGDYPESFAATLDRIMELAPENVTVHTLSIKRAATLNQEGDRSVLENPTDDMVNYSIERLSSAGYAPYYLYRQKNMVGNLENIGWCRPGKESLYNIYIMEEVQTILAMGAGASTKLVDLEGRRIERIFNYKYPLEYIKHFDLMIKRKNGIGEFYGGKI